MVFFDFVQMLVS